MSLLALNKLADSVGAEVRGIEPGGLADNVELGEAVLEALEENGVLVFPIFGLDPEAQVAFCRQLGEIDHSSDGRHPVAGIYPITIDKSKNSSAAYLRATSGTSTIAPRPVTSVRRRPPCCRRCRSPVVAADSRASAGMGASQRAQVTGSGGVGRLHGGHGSGPGIGALLGGVARPSHRTRDGLQPPVVRRGHRHLGQPRSAAPRRTVEGGFSARDAAHDHARRRTHRVRPTGC
jgi:Taurine catabolism dioxygenase TauD, TfdA family